MTEDIKFYLEILKSYECQCGNYKIYTNALCYSCFKKLPDHIQKDLYSKIKFGFEEAYDEAVKWLND